MSPDLSKRSERNVSERVQQRPVVAPLVDVYENRDELLLIADVPGAAKDSIQVHLANGKLTLEARRSQAPSGALVATESRACDYQRVFSVPDGIDPTKIEARFTSGVLRVRLPKSELLRPRRIEIKAG